MVPQDSVSEAMCVSQNQVQTLYIKMDWFSWSLVWASHVFWLPPFWYF